MRLLLLLILLLSGCASITARGLTPRESEAVRVAETFVVRHGYTVAGHPPNLPVQRVSIFDVFRSDDELVKERKGLLEARAVAVENKGGNVFWVYFPEIGQSDSPRIVFVRDWEAEQLFHQSYGPPSRKAVPVPPPSAPSNNSFKVTPDGAPQFNR